MTEIVDTRFETVGRLTEALHRSAKLGGLCDKRAAAVSEIDYDHFQRMMRLGGGRHFPPDNIELLLRGAHNVFALEWQAWRFGLALYPVELMEVLRDIRGALAGDHKHVRFFERILDREPGGKGLIL